MQVQVTVTLQHMTFHNEVVTEETRGVVAEEHGRDFKGKNFSLSLIHGWCIYGMMK